LLSDYYKGECLSTEKLSIVKGEKAFKFRCQNGHTFYKFVSEMREMAIRMQRKCSISTAASQTPAESSDEEMQPSSPKPKSTWQPSCIETWCTRCEELYTDFQGIAQNSDLTLVGKLYSKKLSFKCKAKGHLIKISDCSKRLHQRRISCADCRKDEREAVKREMREEERR